MTRKERNILIIGLLIGAIIGGLIGGLLVHLTISRTIVFILACIGFTAMAYPAIIVILENRKEEREKANRSYPANWGFDKHYEK